MNKNGKIYVVGIGPGKKADMTFKAYEAMEKSDIIVGYKTWKIDKKTSRHWNV